MPFELLNTEPADIDRAPHHMLVHVHVVSSNIFEMSRTYRFPTPAVKYGFRIFQLIGKSTVYTLDEYSKMYRRDKLIRILSIDPNCDIAVTVRRHVLHMEKDYSDKRKRVQIQQNYVVDR